MEKPAVFRVPEAILYGRGSSEKVGAEAALRGKKALIISDKIMDQLGYVSECRTLLQEAGVKSEVYLGVASEPTDEYVVEALTLFQKEQCDMVISVGGGSCIDTAKAIAVLATNGGYIGDYMGGRKLAQNAPVPHIAIPTTAGTGSEATDVTVITNSFNDVKMMIKQPAFMPSVAIVDPLLTISSPKNVTSATGVDALSHAIEAYLSKKAHPMTDTMAVSAMKLIVENILTAYNEGENVDAREAMSLGSLQAGMAFSNASVCLVHGMSRPIGALFHVPHGISNAMLLPAVLEFSQEACIDRLADIGRIFQPDNESLTREEAAEIAVQSVKDLCLKLNIPNLRGWGIDEEAFKAAISKMATDAIDSGSPGNNPRVPTQSELEELYHVCYEYQFSSETEKV
ncbi:iron-containing alcohol dehydrogenase [Cytobacillus oceanisediminis]|uniref:iron-containing alcohol dehydrogenase n=1 Tax=Cytobacillus TaxID=2675230 RepID=UPI00203C3725|nr:iron-containing alcohol dehydrogenase [Cytobacillus oceanisediminis]MBY0159350.1 iron-containing alcohol dehydrogenase [Cytobacillus firmus]MCM3391575.1 iron-containing alcohol dehydrogenase [Cytobacillus oceanisediminis]MCM3529012.1 iron-containing alcohol dehydrogenase [Cytobacillus oceanisediminis]